MYRYIATLRVYRDGAFLFAEEYDAGRGMLDADGLEGQLSDGIFENSRWGKVEELHPVTGKVLGTIYEW